MAPGIPAEDEITAETKPSTRIINASSSTSRPSISGPSFQDRLEDIRDAVTETETYIAISKRTSAVYNSASSLWQLSRNVAWIVGTSALVLVIPLLYEIDKELGPGYEPPGQSSSSSSSSASTPSTTDSAPSPPATDASAATPSSTPPSTGDASLTKSPAAT